MSKEMEWCGVRVIVDDAITELFEMPKPDENPEQEPAFHVTQSTAELVEQDFERYRPSLERMADDWREEKERFMQEKRVTNQTRTDTA